MKTMKSIILKTLLLLSVMGSVSIASYAQRKKILTPEEKFELAAKKRKFYFEHADSIKAAKAKNRQNQYKVLKKNTLAIYPFSTTNASPENVRNINVGMSYERSIHKYLSVKIPVLIAPQTLFTDVSFHLKFFPSAQGRIKYAVGASYYYGRGKIIYKNLYNNLPAETGYRIYSGLMLTHSLNISLHNNLFLGGEIGFGKSVYDYFEVWSGAVDLSGSTMTHMAICAGYRF